MAIALSTKSYIRGGWLIISIFWGVHTFIDLMEEFCDTCQFGIRPPLTKGNYKKWSTLVIDHLRSEHKEVFLIYVIMNWYLTLKYNHLFIDSRILLYWIWVLILSMSLTSLFTCMICGWLFGKNMEIPQFHLFQMAFYLLWLHSWFFQL